MLRRGTYGQLLKHAVRRVFGGTRLVENLAHRRHAAQLKSQTKITVCKFSTAVVRDVFCTHYLGLKNKKTPQMTLFGHHFEKGAVLLLGVPHTFDTGMHMGSK